MLKNRYQARKVAINDSRPCFVCYKPTTCVLTSGEDFFYSCESHLDDKGFAQLDSDSAKALGERERVQKEINILKEKWDKNKSQSAEKDKADEKKKDSNSKSKSQEKEAGDKAKTDSGADDTNEKRTETDPQLPALPPVPTKFYELNKGILTLRVNAKKRAAAEKKTRQLLATPSVFPDAPSHIPK